jgi:immune inhibitor InhA-like protein
MKQRLLRILMAGALAAGSIGTAVAPVAAATTGDPGDPTITVDINDSTAGGTYEQEFERVYAGTTTDGTDVYIYVPVGALDGVEGVDSLDPAFDQDPTDEFTPCADNDPADYVITQEQIDALGDELTNQIVAVDEAHFGDIGLADPTDPDSDALVLLVYNVQDDSYYDCAETTYTAGYFAPEYINEAGMNVIVVDAFDWANRIGDQPEENPEGVDFLYEGVIAHELEHLLMNYSDAGELSWVDEGLADFAAFLNGYPAGGSHITYHQVFHRETSLTRWGGGLENYGASFSFFLYLWEQAGGNGDGTLTPDEEYDGAGGDLLIKLIFAEQADGMDGVQNAIDTFNAETGADLRSAEELFKDWVIALYADDESSDVFNFVNLNFGDPDTTTWTIQLANDLFYKNRGTYKGNVPPARFQNDPHAPNQTALPFGTSYETFRNPGGTFEFTLDGEDTTVVAPHSGDTHWYGGYESQDDNILDVDYTSGDTIDFWTWYFIEEGWDFGFVEALVNGEWVTVPLVDDNGAEVTTNDDPHDNNEEGNGLTGTSGGAYFVDDPVYIHLTGALPDGTTDVRFRYSTDAAYLDTGWFVDDVQIDAQAVTVSSEPGNWIETTGTQDNNWVLQILSPCDLTPNVDDEQSVDQAGYLYRYEGDTIQTAEFSSRCMRSSRDSFVVAISNLPTGDLTYLDADYVFRLVKTK